MRLCKEWDFELGSTEGDLLARQLVAFLAELGLGTLVYVIGATQHNRSRKFFL